MADEVPPEDEQPKSDDVSQEAYDVYQAQTARLKVYAMLLRVTIPRIGDMAWADYGAQEIDVDIDVKTARNLALEAVYRDMRRIAAACKKGAN